MSNFEAAWKKQKPKTLLKDPLSGPLKNLDTNLSKSGGITSTDLAAASGAAKLAIKAIDDTSKAMNKNLHKESLAWLAKLNKDILAIIGYIQDTQKSIAAYLKEVQAKRAQLINNANVVVAHPGIQVASVSAKQFKAYCAWANKEADGIYTLDGNTVFKYASLCGDICNNIAKHLAQQPNGAAEKEKWNKTLAAMVKELKDQIPKIAQLGGLADVKAKHILGSVDMSR